MPTIVHHKAALDGQVAPPNSLEAITACLEHGATLIEIDATALAADDYLLVHDGKLETETTGYGAVAQCSVEQTKHLHISHRGVPTDYTIPLLSDVVTRMREFGGDSRLQIDYKNVYPYPNDEPLRRLIRLLEPLGERVIVSSIADWQLRKLRALAPRLALGFDIQFYLDVRPAHEPVTPTTFPKRVGAYGYWDDHAIASQRIWSLDEYLADRCGALIGLVPQVSALFVRHELITQSIMDGFNWAEAAHRRGVQLDAWTLDADQPEAEINVNRLRDIGVDMLTTNTPVGLSQMMRDL